MAVNDRRYRRAGQGTAGRMAGRLPALQAGRAGYGGTVNPSPTAENVPNLSLRDQSADWSWQSVTPVPIFNVFKSQFENSDIFNFQLSIINSPAVPPSSPDFKNLCSFHNYFAFPLIFFGKSA
ncbi:MAG: hypothetical protein IKQ04_09215 [Oscillospiraceae bacterium]|nr:hypothetical protein [Oscillospiraceae bacterium]